MKGFPGRGSEKISHFENAALCPLWGNTGESSADFIPEALSLIRTVKQLYPEQFELRGFEGENHMRALTGSQKAEEYLDGELELDELMEEWSREAEEFAEESEECRIYR